MESIHAINILGQPDPHQNGRLQTLLENTPSTSADYELRLGMLAKILFDDRAAHQYEPRAAEETEMIAQTFIPITRSIPVEHLYRSYVAAVEARTTGNNFQITAIELLQGWKLLQGTIEMESLTGPKRLTENAAGACERCFGTGQDVAPTGTRPCDHTPLTDAERSARAKAKADGIAWMQAEAAKMRAAKRAAEVAPPKVEAPPVLKLVCTGCGSKGTTLQGWRPGEACTRPPCAGTMELV